MPKGKLYTKEELQTLIALYNEHLSTKHIAQRLNRSHKAISNQLSELKKHNIITKHKAKKEMLTDIKEQQSTTN